MKKDELGGVIYQPKWIDPVTGIEHILGNELENNVIVNGNPNELEAELKLLEAKDGKYLGFGDDGEVFLHKLNNKKYAVKIYHEKRRSDGIDQFKCMRKINELGIESPKVYAASLRTLVMDFISYPMLINTLKFLKPKQSENILKLWDKLMEYICKILPNELIDRSPVNGYVKPCKKGYKLGVFDQG